MSREMRIGVAALIGLGAFTALMLVAGNLGAPRAGIHPMAVGTLLADGPPAARWGDEELHIVGWYAELDAECSGDDGGADALVAWLQRDCPLRILLPDQPSLDVTQEELLDRGVRLAAPLGNVFPSRAQPDGPNLRRQQLVFVGSFDDPRAAGCVPDRREQCENTFVVTDYDEQR